MAFDFISDSFKAFILLFSGDFEGFKEGIIMASTKLFNNIKNLFPGFYEGFTNLWESIEKTTAKIIGRIVVFAIEKLLAIKQVLQSMKDTIVEISTL